MTVACGVNRRDLHLLATDLGAPITLLADVPAILDHLAETPSASLVLLGPELSAEQTLEYAERLREERPAVIVVILGALNRWARERARKAGVSAVLPPDDLRSAGRRCREFLAAGSPAAGRLVTVLAGKAGSGTTTVATNLAVALAEGGRRRVGLVDLDLRSGDVALMLGLDPVRTLAAGPVDGSALDAMVTPYRPGLDCFLAPVRPGAAERLETEGVAALLDALVARYDVVVVDAPAALTGPVVTALDGADHHVLVTTPERPALRGLRTTLDAMDLLGHRRDSRSVLVNRVHPDAGMSAADVDDALRAPIAGSVPWSADVAASINLRSPLMAGLPEHPVSAALRGFTETRLLPSTGLVARALGGAVT